MKTLQAARSAPLALLLGTPMPGWAHPGHDMAPTPDFLEGLARLLTQTDHFALGAGALLIGLLMLGRLRRRRARATLTP